MGTEDQQQSVEDLVASGIISRRALLPVFPAHFETKERADCRARERGQTLRTGTGRGIWEQTPCESLNRGGADPSSLLGSCGQRLTSWSWS